MELRRGQLKVRQHEKAAVPRWVVLVLAAPFIFWRYEWAKRKDSTTGVLWVASKGELVETFVWDEADGDIITEVYGTSQADGHAMSGQAFMRAAAQKVKQSGVITGKDELKAGPTDPSSPFVPHWFVEAQKPETGGVSVH